MKAPLRKVKCHTQSLRSHFFFFACVHHVRLAYISSDLRTCTQRMFARNISASISSIHLYHLHSLPKCHEGDVKKEILPLFLLISRSSQETMSQAWQDTLHKRNSLLLSLCLSATMVTYLSMLTMTVIGVVWMLTSLRARSPRTLRLVPAEQGKGRGGGEKEHERWQAEKNRQRGGGGGEREHERWQAEKNRQRGGGEKEHELRGVRQKKIDREGEERGNMRGGRQRKIDKEGKCKRENELESMKTKKLHERKRKEKHFIRFDYLQPLFG